MNGYEMLTAARSKQEYLEAFRTLREEKRGSGLVPELAEKFFEAGYDACLYDMGKGGKEV